MKKVLLFGLLFFLTSAIATAQLNETFDDDSGFTVTTGGFQSDGTGDYFGIADPVGATDDFGAGSEPSQLKAYTGFTGNFLTGMDLDGDGTNPIIIEWTVDISGIADVGFAGEFAEFFDSPGDIDQADDQILVEYDIDGNGFQNLIAFEGADFSSGSFNGVFREDTDFDGEGDGTALGDAAQLFLKDIPGTGTTLTLRLTVSVDSGDEDFAVDNFRINEFAVLPIELTYFTATPKSDVVALNWRTETELNNAYMAVERSLDGENFAEIGRVKGAGTTVEPQEYSFIDEAPKTGINYYRLRQVDTDGTVNYHKVVAVSFDTKDIATTLFPTVANDFVMVQTSKVAETEGVVTVMSLTGKIVTELAFAKGADQIELNVANLAAGQYFVRLAVDGTVTTTRFVKQ